MSESAEHYSTPVAAPSTRSWGTSDLFMLATCVIWGINFTLVKLSLISFDPLVFNALRFGLATVTMVAILRLRGESLWLHRQDIVPMIFLGLSGHAIYQMLFINGIDRTSPASTSLLMGSSPIFVAIVGHVLGVERANRAIWVGIVVSFLGIALLILGGPGGVQLENGTTLGDLLILSGAAIWAFYTTGSKRMLARYSALKVTAMAMVFGTPPLVLGSLSAMARQDWGTIPSLHWGGLLYSSILSVAVGYTVWTVSVKRVGNARTAVYSNLTPVVTIFVAWMALGTGLTSMQWLGALVVLAGLLLTRKGRVR